jgi:dihydrofolate synthase / folylpolyglutamate synthase
VTPKNTVEDWLSGLGAPAADRDYKPGHARVAGLLAGMRLTRPKLRIRIAGTNGKGSTAHMLAAGLSAGGLSVGLYTSPHIHCFNERIRIDGRAVTDAELLAHLPPIVVRAKEIDASYFEVATALALQCFSNANIDVEVLEAGVGARLDATTAVPADMALLTPVALDHQAWLGDTLAAIAAEKAHVFDGCRWRLSAMQAEVVRHVVDEMAPGTRYIEPVDGLKLAMAGRYQQQNAALALAAIDTLQASGMLPADGLVTANIRRVVAAVTVPGRLQQARLGNQTFWLDAAHNRHAVEALLPILSGMAPFDAIFVFTREDRDLTDALPLLGGLTERLIGGRPAACLHACYGSVQEALEREAGKPGGRYLVLGSFLTVAAADDWLTVRGAMN